MIAYGEKKRKNKLHPHNRCDICSEKNFNKKTARQDARKEISMELSQIIFNLTFIEKCDILDRNI